MDWIDGDGKIIFLDADEVLELEQINEEWKKISDNKKAKKISEILGIKIYSKNLHQDYIAIRIMKRDNLNGICPNLLNDDCGRWAYFSDGMQNVPDSEKPIDIETSFSVPASYWKETIAEAVCFGVFAREF